MNLPSLTPIRAAIVALLAAVAITIVITVPGDDPSKPPATVTVRLGAPALALPDVPDTLEIPAADLAAAKKGQAGDHGDGRDELPDGVPAPELRAGQAQQDELAQRDDLPVVTPAAAPEQAGCRSRFVQNYSSRRGVRPRLFVVHYTVSSNRPGLGDVEAIDGLFNTPSFAASSNYVLDDEAHCDYIVRESDKAWTQATFNPVSISVEIIATGREGRLTSAAGYAKLGRVISDATKRWGIPLQTGAVSGCTVTRPGIVTHQMLGSCGGGHVDISPYSLAPVIAAAKAARGGAPVGASSATKAERSKVATLLRERKIATRNHGWSKVAPAHLRTAKQAKAWIVARLKTITTGEQANRPARRVYLRSIVGG
jgi:hypothetical protein